MCRHLPRLDSTLMPHPIKSYRSGLLSGLPKIRLGTRFPRRFLPFANARAEARKPRGGCTGGRVRFAHVCARARCANVRARLPRLQAVTFGPPRVLELSGRQPKSAKQHGKWGFVSAGSNGAPEAPAGRPGHPKCMAWPRLCPPWPAGANKVARKTGSFENLVSMPRTVGGASLLSTYFQRTPRLAAGCMRSFFVQIPTSLGSPGSLGVC